MTLTGWKPWAHTSLLHIIFGWPENYLSVWPVIIHWALYTPATSLSLYSYTLCVCVCSMQFDDHKNTAYWIVGARFTYGDIGQLWCTLDVWNRFDYWPLTWTFREAFVYSASRLLTYFINAFPVMRTKEKHIWSTESNAYLISKEMTLDGRLYQWRFSITCLQPLLNWNPVYYSFALFQSTNHGRCWEFCEVNSSMSITCNDWVFLKDRDKS